MNIKKVTALFLLVMFSSGQIINGEKQYSIEMRDAPLVDAIRLLVTLQGSNVIIPDKAEGVVTANFPAISLGSALNAVMESKELGMIVKNNVVQIISKKDIEAIGGDLLTKTFRLKYSNTKEIKDQLKSLSSTRGSIMTDERTNSITIRDSQVNIKNIDALIKDIDKPDRQVLIEARIVEAASDFARALGVEWGLNFSTGGFSVSRTSPSMPNGVALGLRPPMPVSLDLALTAAEQKGELKIISRPSIVTMNNQAATISSGFKFYVRAPGNVNIGTDGASSASSSGTSTGSNLQEITAGISMIVTPQITADNNISLSINVAESQPDFSKAIEGIPTIADNSANTTVSLRDGEITVIAGLFQAQDASTKSGLPFLRDIPIFGPLLFGTDSTGKIKKELLIFIKPTIVKEEEANSHILKNATVDYAEEPAKKATSAAVAKEPRAQPVSW